MARRIDIEEDDGVLILSLTLWGRVVAGFYRGVKIFPWLALIAGVFFLPDFIGQFDTAEPVPPLFWWGSILGLVVLLSALWGVLRVVRRERWIFDGNDRQMVAEIPRLWRDPVQGEAQLREIESFELTTRGWPRQSELAVNIASPDTGDHREQIFAEHGMDDQIEAAAEAIIDFMRRQRYPVDLQRPDDNGSSQ